MQLRSSTTNEGDNVTRWILVNGDRVLVRDDDVPSFPTTAEVALPESHLVGTYGGTEFWAAPVADAPDGYRFEPLRPLHAVLGDELWFAAGRAVQLVAWAETHRYCGRCGSPTIRVPGERAMGCDNCRLHAYPRLAPAVIMVVRRGDTMLLARGSRFPTPMYSALAGFVEPGESLEEAVRREVLEEVGITVGAVEYFGSQPWPFPHSLMIGFFGEYEGGEIDVDPTEIIDAQWYRPDSLPMVPGPPSIASKLIAEMSRRLA